jgi:endonuclease/exonuclease/phosphatase family metal-dependent hydrolase
MDVRALTWNIYHGRDFPPDPSLFTRRSRLRGTTERSATHVQVNRDLFDQFAGILSRGTWDVALLQEAPPRWAGPLAPACDAAYRISLTSRNGLGSIRARLAVRNPDLVGSSEGGSNQILVRSPLAIAASDDAVLTRRPERRTVLLVRLESGLCLANLHASTDPRRAAEEVLNAAERAVDFAGSGPLIFGGDFNVRPAESDVYAELERRFRLRTPTAPDAIDHLLARGLDILEPPTPWPPEARELPYDGLAVRLSDHAPVEARFGLSETDPGKPRSGSG